MQCQTCKPTDRWHKTGFGQTKLGHAKTYMYRARPKMSIKLTHKLFHAHSAKSIGGVGGGWQQLTKVSFVWRAAQYTVHCWCEVCVCVSVCVCVCVWVSIKSYPLPNSVAWVGRGRSRHENECTVYVMAGTNYVSATSPFTDMQTLYTAIANQTSSTYIFGLKAWKCWNAWFNLNIYLLS